jgi:hypothetical protein
MGTIRPILSLPIGPWQLDIAGDGCTLRQVHEDDRPTDLLDILSGVAEHFKAVELISEIDHSPFFTSWASSFRETPKKLTLCNWALSCDWLQKPEVEEFSVTGVVSMPVLFSMVPCSAVESVIIRVGEHDLVADIATACSRAFQGLTDIVVVPPIPGDDVAVLSKRLKVAVSCLTN